MNSYDICPQCGGEGFVELPSVKLPATPAEGEAASEERNERLRRIQWDSFLTEPMTMRQEDIDGLK
ncbi:MAG: hypothetical protein ACPH5P_00065 [Akkermansiaceae bacterium]